MIESGLKPGERVVLSGLQRVRPGMKVNAKNVAMAAKDTPVAAAAEAPAGFARRRPRRSRPTAGGKPAAPPSNPVTDGQSQAGR